MVKAKKKYGINTFNKAYSVDVEATYGQLTYLDTIATERFNYIDLDNGTIYDSQVELDKEQPDKNKQKGIKRLFFQFLKNWLPCFKIGKFNKNMSLQNSISFKPINNLYLRILILNGT